MYFKSCKNHVSFFYTYHLAIMTSNQGCSDVMSIAEDIKVLVTYKDGETGMCVVSPVHRQRLLGLFMDVCGMLQASNEKIILPSHSSHKMIITLLED